MKKFLKIFLAVIFVIAIAVVGLITFVDPNDYRSYMIQKVQQKTGYTLEINGDLRWHIWPQVSILADDVTVTAPGAKDKMVKAENMRLDVEIIPLFSKRLAVKEVLLKGAVVRLTDDTYPALANKDQNAAGQAAGNKAEEANEGAKAAQEWSLALNRFEIVNSLFVLQQSANKDDLLTVRNINVLLAMKGQRQVNLTARSNIIRNQKSVIAMIKADLDLQQYPKQVALTVDELSYQLRGPKLPAEGITGKASGRIGYRLEDKNVALTDLRASVNNETIEGEINGVLGERPHFTAKLNADTSGGAITGEVSGELGDIADFIIKVNSDKLDIDKLRAAFAAATEANQPENQNAAGVKPPQSTGVSKAANEPSHELAFLNGLNAKLLLNVNALVVNGMPINSIVVDADNKQGDIQLKKLSAQLLGGSVSAPGSINVKSSAPFVRLSPNVQNIDMDALSKALGISQTLSGQLNVSGKISGPGLKAEAIKNAWSGQLNTRIDNARLNNLNLKQIIHQAAILTNKDAKVDERYEKYTQVRTLSALLLLQKGNVKINDIDVDSRALNVSGSGTIGLAKMQCNISLNVRVLQGWQGKKEIVDILQAATIPVHIYGPCNNLAYKINVERIVRDRLKSEANKAIDKYLGGNSEQRKRNAIDAILGDIVGKK